MNKGILTELNSKRKVGHDSTPVGVKQGKEDLKVNNIFFGNFD